MTGGIFRDTKTVESWRCKYTKVDFGVLFVLIPLSRLFI